MTESQGLIIAGAAALAAIAGGLVGLMPVPCDKPCCVRERKAIADAKRAEQERQEAELAHAFHERYHKDAPISSCPYCPR